MASVKVVSKDSTGEEKIIFVKRPGPKQTSEAKIYSNILATRLMNTKDANGKPAIILRSQVDEYLRSLGVWSENDEIKIKDLQKQIADDERKLAVGGIKKTQGRDIARDIIKLRNEQDEILSKRGELDRLTLEAQIEQANFDCLISLCLTNEDGTPCFTSTENYLENTKEPYAFDGAIELSKIVFGEREDTRKNLPEYKFLLKYGFINDKYEWIRADGKVIDIETGLLVNDKGRYINESGEFINSSGERINEDGSPVVENFTEFTD